MPIWSYVGQELSIRGRRARINISLIALSIGLFLIMNAAANAIGAALQAPLSDVGADLTVQKSGDVPEKMTGPVLPCSVAPIHAGQIDRIKSLDGVISVSPVLLFWDFGPEEFLVAAGFSPDDPAGYSLLRKTLVKGRFLETGETGQALVEKSQADQAGLDIGDDIRIGNRSFIVCGLVDSSLLSHLASAQVYISLKDAREIAASAEGIRAVHDFRPRDVNLLFIKARRDRLDELKAGIVRELGDGVTVTSPKSFARTLGGLFTVTDRFAGTVSLLALLAAAVLTARTTMSNILERRMDIGVMKAVGWQGRDITGQMIAETAVQLLLGAALGFVLAWFLAFLLSFWQIPIPIPWDMSPRPHFLPGGGDQLFRNVRLHLTVTPALALAALGATLVIGLAAVRAGARALAGVKASEVLRYE